MKRLLTISVLAGMAASLLAAEPLGKISGTISKISNLEKVFAVEVNTGKITAGKLEPGGRFVVSGLAEGEYFLAFKGANDVLEGMRFSDEVYAGLPLTAADKAELEKVIYKQETFLPTKQFWAFDGGSKRAIAFVFNERSQPWFLNAGDHITDKVAYRLDFYLFQRAGEMWKVMDKSPYIMLREEFSKSSPPKWKHTHADALGGLVLDAKHQQATVNY